MGINRIMRNALRTNWALTDDFMFTFTNNHRPLNTSGTDISVQDILDIAVINVDLPQLGSDVESVMQAGEWRIYNAKFQPFSFSVTFRDFGALNLRSYFSQVWMDAQRGYYDEVKSFVRISMDGGIVFESEDCLISAVSQVQLDNNNSQIAEFTVEFTSPYYSNAEVTRFGSDEYHNYEKSLLTTQLSINLGDAAADIIGPLQNIISTVSDWLS